MLTDPVSADHFHGSLKEFAVASQMLEGGSFAGERRWWMKLQIATDVVEIKGVQSCSKHR